MGAAPPLAVRVWLNAVPTIAAGSQVGASVIAGQLMVLSAWIEATLAGSAAPIAVKLPPANTDASLSARQRTVLFELGFQLLASPLWTSSAAMRLRV